MSKSIGIKLADGTFYPILEEGKPDNKRLELTTVKDNQETVQVDLYRSETNSMDDAEYVDSLQIENLIARPNGEPTLAFDISLDENDNLSAKICDPESGEKSDIAIKLVNRGENERSSVPNFDLNTDTLEMNEDQVSEDELANTDNISLDAPIDETVLDTPASEESEAQEEQHSGGLLAAAAALGAAGAVGAGIAAASQDSDIDNLPEENIEDPFGTEDAATQPDVQIDAQPDAASDDFSVDDNSINLFAEEGSENTAPAAPDVSDSSFDLPETEEPIDSGAASESIDFGAVDSPADESGGTENNENPSDDISLDLPDFADEEPLPENPMEEAVIPEQDSITDEIETPSIDAMDSALSLDDDFGLGDDSGDATQTSETTLNMDDSVSETDSQLKTESVTETNTDVTSDETVQAEDTALPDIDFDETVPLDSDAGSVSAEETVPLTESETKDDSFFDLPDFDNIDLDSESKSENSEITDTAETFAAAKTMTSSPDEGLRFNDLYDEETLDGSSTENAVKKTKKHVVICVICAIICIIATLLVLFVIPSKLNIAKSKKSAAKEETIVLAPKPVEEPVPAKPVEQPEPVKPVVSPAKENEVVVAPTPNVVPVKPAAPKAKKEDIRYKIRWGDTLWDISEAYYKTPWKYPKIAKYNKIKNPDHIISGTTIVIPQE